MLQDVGLKGLDKDKWSGSLRVLSAQATEEPHIDL